MNDHTAYCGLHCETCDARTATVNQDDALSQQRAEVWSGRNSAESTPEMIHSTSCRTEGPKKALCPKRPCAMEKAAAVCGGYAEMETSSSPAAPDAVKDLREATYLSLRDRPELLESAAAWFHEKWGVPKEAYHVCMTAYLNRETEYGWYLCLAGDHIIGGLGVIDNDFHDRRDLFPNVCAVYTEEDFRGHGIAGHLLALVVEDQRTKGIVPLFLVTEHTGFYERYGWEFLCMARDENSGNETRVYMHR